MKNGRGHAPMYARNTPIRHISNKCGPVGLAGLHRTRKELSRTLWVRLNGRESRTQPALASNSCLCSSRRVIFLVPAPYGRPLPARSSSRPVTKLVSCPGDNVMSRDPSDNYETESVGAEDHGRTAARVEQVGGFADVARGRCLPSPAHPGALADGKSYSQIMSSLQTTAPTISRWKQRFEQDGMDGLDPRHKGLQPRVA